MTLLGFLLATVHVYFLIDAGARAAFDTVHTGGDPTAPDRTAPGWSPEPRVPVHGSRWIESTQVIHRTKGGGTITVLHLTPEAKAGLSTNGATIRLATDSVPSARVVRGGRR